MDDAVQIDELNREDLDSTEIEVNKLIDSFDIPGKDRARLERWVRETFQRMRDLLEVRGSIKKVTKVG